MGGDEAWELQAGYICRTRGAWLIIVHDTEGEPLPDDEFIAASSTSSTVYGSVPKPATFQ